MTTPWTVTFVARKHPQTRVRRRNVQGSKCTSSHMILLRGACCWEHGTLWVHCYCDFHVFNPTRTSQRDIVLKWRCCLLLCTVRERTYKDHISSENVYVTDSESVCNVTLPLGLQGSALDVGEPMATSSQGKYKKPIHVLSSCVICVNISFCSRPVTCR